MIYVTGDMHGDPERFSERTLRRLRDSDTLIILGDFGFVWNGGEEENKNLDFIRTRRYQVLFIEGTHENIDLLYKYPVEEYCDGKVRALGGNLRMLMRGEIYNIEGKSIFALGGGGSVDAEFREEGISWWPQELPSAEEIEYARNNLKYHGPVDYIVTHEPPQKIKKSITGTDGDENRLSIFFDEVMTKTKYQKWFFGYFHMDRKITRTHYAVYQNIIEILNPEKKGFFARLFGKKK